MRNVQGARTHSLLSSLDNWLPPAFVPSEQMTQLTPYEYDTVLDDAAKAALAGIVRQPHKDKKSDQYRKRYGRYLNGELDADPVASEVVGYGTGIQPLHPLPTLPPNG